MSVVGWETPLTSRRLRCPEWKGSGIEDQDGSGARQIYVQSVAGGGGGLLFESASSSREEKKSVS